MIHKTGKTKYQAIFVMTAGTIFLGGKSICSIIATIPVSAAGKLFTDKLSYGNMHS